MNGEVFGFFGIVSKVQTKLVPFVTSDTVVIFDRTSIKAPIKSYRLNQNNNNNNNLTDIVLVN